MRYVIFFLALQGCATVKTSMPSGEGLIITRSNVDVLLQPGDVMFRYVDPNDPLIDAVSGGIIKGTQTAKQGLSSLVNFTVDSVRGLLKVSDERFNSALNEGDPNAVHMAIYLGNGETAEAFGTTASDASVNRWSLLAPDRNGTAWRVFRYRDARVAQSLVQVARTWATGRMTYSVPFEVFVRDAEWGERARRAAFLYAQSSDSPGGPPSVGAMFCSQFAVAALQAAGARVYLGTPLNDLALEALPQALKIDSVASPVRVYGWWLKSDAFTAVGHLVVDAAAPR